MNNAGWKTIDTCPKDGTYVQGWRSDRGVNEYLGKIWFDDDHGCFVDAYDIVEATHWMPIPEGPSRERLE